MKLWIVAQWGNKEEGADGKDTQCIVRSNSMLAAIKCAEGCFWLWEWKNGQADTAIILGDDGLPDDNNAKVIVPVWFAPAYNLGKYPSWHRHPETNEWLDAKTMFGYQ